MSYLNLSKKRLAAVIITLLLAVVALAQVPAGTTPCLFWRETDQALPLGLWRVCLDGNAWKIQQNTAVAGNFTTTTTWFQANNSAVSFPNNNVLLSAPSILNPDITGTVTTSGLILPGFQLGGDILAIANKITGLAQGTNTGEAIHAGRSVATGLGLTGGGNLTADRTISLDTTYSPSWSGVHSFDGSEPIVFLDEGPKINSPAGQLVLAREVDLIDNTLTDLLTIDNDMDKEATGVNFTYSVIVGAGMMGGTMQVEVGEGRILAYNTGGGTTAQTVVKVGNSQLLESGTVTVTFAVVDAGGTKLQVTVDSSLNVDSVIRFTVINNSPRLITF